MESFSDLVFMDKRGRDYGWDYDPERKLWTGSIMIDRVSRGLFETEKIVCMQRYPVRWMGSETEGDKPVGGVWTYEYGRAGGNPGDFYAWQWDDSVTEVNEINMFRFDHTFCPPEDTSALTYNEYDCPEIEFAAQVRIEPLAPVTVEVEARDFETEPKYIRYKVDKLVPKADVVDLCFCNDGNRYDTFRRDLFLFYYDSANDRYMKVAEICVYAESVDEDERFTTLCANLGYRITNDDFKIFRDSDIKEQKIDLVLMNEKRKEMLMEGHTIYPYIGSYKSLINVIRYFGYDNIHIKEWWKNVDVTSEDYGNYFIATSYSLENRESVRVNGRKVSLPSKKFRKTNRMTMAWDIDRVVKEVYGRKSAHDLPDTEEVFAFTIEEAVIKLYAFRRKLEKEFLPLNCHIVDMVGEMFGFDCGVVRLNVSDSKTFDTFVGCECDFMVITEDEDVYLEDLRRFNVFNENVPQPTAGDVVLRDIYDEYIRAYNVLDTDGKVVMPLAAGEDEEFVGLDDETCIIDGVQLRNGKPISLLGKPALYDVRDMKNGCTWNYYKYRLSMEGAMTEGTGGPLRSMRYDLDFTASDTCTVPCPVSDGTIVEVRDAEHNVVSCAIAATEGGIAITAEGHPEGLYAVIHTVSGAAAGNYYVANFSHYYPNLDSNSVRANTFTQDMNRHLPDNENALCGALVRLRCMGLGTAWDDAPNKWENTPCSWDECENYIRNHQRITWEIWKPEDGTQEFITSITGEFRYGYGDIGILLPYVGKYSVRCVIRGFDNSISERIKTECIEVLPKNVEITGWFKHKVDTYGCWNDIPENVKWRDADYTWMFPYIACDATWDDMRTATYESLNRATFAGEYYDSDDLDERMVVNTFDQTRHDEMHSDWNGIYFWDNLNDVDWLGVEHLDWKSTVIGGDARTHFIIGGFGPDGSRRWTRNDITLEVVTGDKRYGRFIFGENESGLMDVEYYVNMLNESPDEIIGAFEYHYFSPFNHRTDAPFNNIECDRYEIIAVAKRIDTKILHAGMNEAANTAGYTNGVWTLKPTDDTAVSSLMLHWYTEKQYNPTWIDTTYMNTFTSVPANTDINLNYSVSRIVGKCCPKWEVRNLDNPDTPVITSTHKNFHHLFRDTGRYNVRLELMDTNGNRYVSDRCMFEVV